MIKLLSDRVRPGSEMGGHARAALAAGATGLLVTALTLFVAGQPWRFGFWNAVGGLGLLLWFELFFLVPTWIATWLLGLVVSYGLSRIRSARVRRILPLLAAVPFGGAVVTLVLSDIGFDRGVDLRVTLIGMLAGASACWAYMRTSRTGPDGRNPSGVGWWEEPDAA